MAFALGDVISGSATFKARAQTELKAATDTKIRTFQVRQDDLKTMSYTGRKFTIV